jgi:hypothetical protein
MAKAGFDEFQDEIMIPDPAFEPRPVLALHPAKWWNLRGNYLLIHHCYARGIAPRSEGSILQSVYRAPVWRVPAVAPGHPPAWKDVVMEISRYQEKRGVKYAGPRQLFLVFYVAWAARSSAIPIVPVALFQAIWKRMSFSKSCFAKLLRNALFVHDLHIDQPKDTEFLSCFEKATVDDNFIEL